MHTDALSHTRVTVRVPGADRSRCPPHSRLLALERSLEPNSQPPSLELEPPAQPQAGGRWPRPLATPTSLLLQLAQPPQRGLQAQVQLVAGAEQPQQVAGARSAARVVHQLPGRGQPVRPDLELLPLNEGATTCSFRRKPGWQDSCVSSISHNAEVGTGHCFCLQTSFPHAGALLGVH